MGNCASCKFWDRTTTTSGWGVCHRNAPHTYQQQTDEPADAVWPTTTESDWCGEYKEPADE